MADPVVSRRDVARGGQKVFGASVAAGVRQPVSVGVAPVRQLAAMGHNRQSGSSTTGLNC